MCPAAASVRVRGESPSRPVALWMGKDTGCARKSSPEGDLRMSNAATSFQVGPAKVAQLVTSMAPLPTGALKVMAQTMAAVPSLWICSTPGWT